MKIGYVGLGKMGKNMVLRLLEQGIEVVAWNRSAEPILNIKNQIVNSKNAQDKFSVASLIEELVEHLPKPRIIWLMLPAGEVTDEFIDKLLPLLSSNDLIIDGGNSFYKDTLRRAEKIQSKGVRFIDIGTSGGPNGARTGACLMVGGSISDFKAIEPIVKAASAPNAYAHLGEIGAGHFAKMVHNGIEYGMMEAIAEGAAILKHGPFKFDFVKLFDLYNHRSVIESRLVGWALDAFKEDQDLKVTSSTISSTGEGEWTVKTAREMGIDVPVLEDSVKVRQNSTKDSEGSPSDFRNKVVSAMRGKFGNHAVKKERDSESSSE